MRRRAAVGQAQQREVGVGVAADFFGAVFAAVVQRHRDLVAGFGDVLVRDEVAVGRDQKTRPGSAAPAEQAQADDAAAGPFEGGDHGA